MASRFEVYTALDSEREYQTRRWPGHVHSIEEYIVYIEDYLQELKHLLSRNNDSDVRLKVLNTLRKVTALGVAAMEDNGTVMRID